MRKLLIIFVLFLNHVCFSQQTNIYHVVSKGETLSKIAQKYNLTPYDIIKLNPNAKNGVFEKDVLIIPKTDVDAQSTLLSSKNDKIATVKTEKNPNKLFHVVQSKETKYGISKLYGVTIQELESQNPNIVSGLQAGSKLQITGSTTNYKQDLSQTKEITKFDSKISYTVLPKETIYGISRRNGISIEELVSVNPALKDGLKSGQKINIPVKKNSVNINESVVNSSDLKYHVVEPKETKFELSRKYGVTIDQLENLNPQIVKGLQIGQKITIPSSYKGNDDKIGNVVVALNKINEMPKIIKSDLKTTNQEYVNYEIQPKETLFSLSKKAGMPIQELTTLNPKLATAVQIGMVIKMPKNANLISNTPLVSSEKVKKESVREVAAVHISDLKSDNRYKDLSKTIDRSSKKQLALVLPFDDAKYQSWLKISSNFISVQDEFVKNDLQFYSGAIKAIDSIKKMNLNIEVKLVNLENKDSSLEKLLVDDNVMKSNALIMPYYDKTSEGMASGLSKLNIPVITNQIIKDDKGYSNLYVSVPSEKDIRSSVLNYLKTKNTNLIVVNSNERTESKNAIIEKFPDAKFVKTSDKDFVDTDDLKKLLVKNKINYVILDTDKSSMIIGSTNVLLSEFADFKIQIVVLEPSLLSSFENVSSVRINILKMIYPSLNSAANSSKLDKITRNKSNDYNENFLLGFDITFDTLLRLAQSKDFETSAKEDITEYLKLKFEYNKNKIGTNVNKGFYILQHDTDEKIKELN